MESGEEEKEEERRMEKLFFYLFINFFRKMLKLNTFLKN
jgi:hypothetical protein